MTNRLFGVHSYLQISVRCQILFLFIILFLTSPYITAVEQASNIDLHNTNLIKRGKLIYKRFCSLCHGRKLEGQKNWRTRDKNGKLPAPPHDKNGHTWHHSDNVLFSVVKYGMVPPNAPENYLSDMPAWKQTLNDKDIWAVLTFIKSTWPVDILEKQLEINRLSLENR